MFDGQNIGHVPKIAMKVFESRVPKPTFNFTLYKHQWEKHDDVSEKAYHGIMLMEKEGRFFMIQHRL